MLRELRIRDFAIIDDLIIHFQPGLNVITGETGAGKSVILEALSLLCGGRAAPEAIRGDAESATIEGLFEEVQAGEVFEALGLTAGEEVLVRRVIAPAGRGRVWINGSPATVGLLGQLGDSLVHIYGQHDQALLLRPSSHLQLLDAFGSLAERAGRMSAAWAELSAARRRLNELTARNESAAERRTFLEGAVEELARADVKPDEEPALRRDREILRHAERLHELTRGSEEALYSGEGAMVSRLSRLTTQLGEAVAVDPSLGGAAELIESARVQMEEAAQQLRAYADRIDVDPQKLEALDDRLALLGRLARRYAVPSAELPDLFRRLQEELSLAGDAEVDVDRARHELAARMAETRRVATELSERRRVAARRLEREMRAELATLGLAGAVFRVRIEPPAAESATEDALGPTGFDAIEFFLSANPGEDPKPLAQVASGGELSRVMLALKALTATSAETPILVFDEVDAGVGGGVADAVARRLKALAANRQLLCITHLPQIAAYADHHFAVEKRRERGRTIARARRLDAGDRIAELARMLGGTVAPAEAEIYARRLVDEARKHGAEP
jgi:DNA repair protein RecN (Recombination protein N)